MKKTIFLTLLLTCLVSLSTLGMFITASATPPPPPSNLYGTARLDGANVPDGTEITAWINGVQYASTTTFTYNGDSVYTMDVPGDISDTPEIEGGVEGDTIVFEIDGQTADQSGTWHSGTSQELNLTDSTSPTANFTYAPAPAAPTYQFNDVSTPGNGTLNAWSWDFGFSPDGVSSEQNAQVTFPTCDVSYDVSLTVTDTNGLSDTHTETVSVPACDTLLYIFPPTQTVGKGQTATVEIWLADVENAYGFDITLTFTALVSTTEEMITLAAPWNDGYVLKQVDNDTHTVQLVVTLIAPASPMNGTIQLATVTFDTLDAGTVPLVLDSTKVLDTSAAAIPHTTQDGEIVIVEGFTAAGSCTLQGRTDHTGCTIQIGDSNDTTGSDSAYQMMVSPAGSYTAIADAPRYLCAETTVAGNPGESITLNTVELRAGDANDDGTIGLADLVIVGANYGYTCPLNDPRSDINGDCQVDLADLVLVGSNYSKTCPQPWDELP